MYVFELQMKDQGVKIFPESVEGEFCEWKFEEDLNMPPDPIVEYQEEVKLTTRDFPPKNLTPVKKSNISARKKRFSKRNYQRTIGRKTLEEKKN